MFPTGQPLASSKCECVFDQIPCYQRSPPASEIVKLANQWPADLIVIGSHVSRVLLGNVAEAVMRRVQWPECRLSIKPRISAAVTTLAALGSMGTVASMLSLLPLPQLSWL